MRDDLTLTARRARITADIMAKTGITEPMIDLVVRGFYDRVRKDTLLGPIFENHITGWDTHLLRMVSFWSSVILMSGRYQGNPMEKHKNLSVNVVHFQRWLAVFDETLKEVCHPAARAYFTERAERIAQSLMIGIARTDRDGVPILVTHQTGPHP